MGGSPEEAINECAPSVRARGTNDDKGAGNDDRRPGDPGRRVELDSVMSQSLRLQKVPWFVVQDDVIGGWAISNVDKPVSEIDTRDGSEFVITDFISKALADYIVGLHNWNIEKEEL
jgi:hypothetical protein